MRFLAFKNRSKFTCEHGGFSQRQSHIKLKSHLSIYLDFWAADIISSVTSALIEMALA